MPETVSVSLSTFMTLQSDAAKKHRVGLDEGWQIGDEFVDLHVAALSKISELTRTAPSESEMTLTRVSCHGLNLYVSAVELTMSGKFDVALLLLRPLFDCGPLAFAVAKDEETAKKFNKDKLTAADARKLQRDYIKSFEPELAAGLNDQWSEEYRAVNKASHVQALHAEKLITVADGRVTPWVGGREDLDECRRLLKAANMGEFWHLSSLSNFRVELLGGDWIRRFKGAGKKFASWMRDTK